MAAAKEGLLLSFGVDVVGMLVECVGLVHLLRHLQRLVLHVFNLLALAFLVPLYDLKFNFQKLQTAFELVKLLESVLRCSAGRLGSLWHCRMQVEESSDAVVLLFKCAQRGLPPVEVNQVGEAQVFDRHKRMFQVDV